MDINDIYKGDYPSRSNKMMHMSEVLFCNSRLPESVKSVPAIGGKVLINNLTL